MKSCDLFRILQILWTPSPREMQTTVFTYNFRVTAEYLPYCEPLPCIGAKQKQNKTKTNKQTGTSLVAQWLRIRRPMQGTQVRALVREDPTCRRATKPMCHNYWACALEPMSHNYLKPTCLEPALRNERSHGNEKLSPQQRGAPCSTQLEKARTQQQRPNAAKNKIINL